MRRFSTTLQARIILTYLILFLVSAAVMTGLAGWFYSQSALENAIRSLQAQVYVAASALERPLVLVESFGRNLSLPDLELLTQRFAQDATSHISVVDGRGNVLATSLPNAPSSQATSPEVEAALAGKTAYAVRWDPLSRQTTIYVAAPVRRLGRSLFAVQLSLPLAEVTKQTRRFWLSLGLTALLAALAAAVAGWGLAQTVARPVGRLRAAVSCLADGEFGERVSEQESGGVVEIAELAAAFNNMAERVQEMIDRQRMFVANASHELRTPITNIKLRAEALGGGALADPLVGPRFTAEIEREADRLGRMASELLTLSRQDAAPSPPREAVDLNVLAQEIVSAMTLHATRREVALTTDLASDGLRLWGDADGLRTVLVNLLDNALRYTPAGGRVEVRTRQAGQQAALEVADTGIGIPTEDLPHIFERFYRVDKARSRKGAGASSGAGLGLAIVQGIVKAHGGTIVAESTLGQGTTIKVALPAS
ncbi:MAG: cell wall metabolism sensor histidine kinase WalK [Chloroflexi bacterium]|nr:cell wall metabolism sensor histidine kinase WalK [Chloroflexota bacterium]